VFHDYVGTEHMLLGLLREDCGIGYAVLSNFDLTLEKACAEVERLVAPGREQLMPYKMVQTPKGKRAIELAIAEADRLKHHDVSSEHLARDSLVPLLCRALTLAIDD
jgi:ATP-dependent Clp protease ATP-binding subunit ClpC